MYIVILEIGYSTAEFWFKNINDASKFMDVVIKSKKDEEDKVKVRLEYEKREEEIDGE
jgi:hypothetical protein